MEGASGGALEGEPAAGDPLDDDDARGWGLVGEFVVEGFG